MKLLRPLLLSLLALTGPLAAARPALAAPMSPAQAAGIDAAVKAGMARVGSKGLALAVVEDGKVVLVRSYGIRNVQGEPLTPDTLLYAASLTKVVFAYTVARLADEGRLNLDRPVAALLPQPLPSYGNLEAYGNWGDLAGDERWRRITPRMILNHATGFANYAFLEPDQRLRFHFDPGTRYGYSGEGIILLQFALEKGLGLDVEAQMERLTFAPLGMTRSSLIWRSEFGTMPVAQGWRSDGQAFEHDRQDNVRASGTMDTTIGDIARFAAALVSGTNLSPRLRREMFRPQLAITTASQFPTLQPELPPAQRRRDLAAGLGVVVFEGPQGPAFFKGGHNDQTANTLVCVQRHRRCVVILGNDVRDERLFPELVKAALGETGAPWRWEYPEQFAN